jgi:hypothetical protein
MKSRTYSWQSAGIGANLERIASELGTGAGKPLSRMRKLIKEADPDVVEEWKWMGTRFGHTTASSALANPTRVS